MQTAVPTRSNLFVSDGSFMPTGGSVPYTFTIYANSFRVADHIVAQLGAHAEMPNGHGRFTLALHAPRRGCRKPCLLLPDRRGALTTPPEGKQDQARFAGFTSKGG